ncbi:MAG: hypothetical protein LN545_04295 [Candidatus Megaira endosymbiont of Carteria cerasiformis]|nr:hypothetical protein [Candidatus Megaera polyxenophila]MCC8461192.1 hypothetical protein [Candidatus Megaera polyxenophila]
MIDFNSVASAFSLIPAGTIAKAVITLKSGNYGEQKLLTKSDKTGSIGLNVCFTITSGNYANRKIYQLIGFQGAKKDENGKDRWAEMGLSLIRSIIESSRNINPSDTTLEAMAKRKVALSELHNMQPIIKIGVEVDKSGKYPDKNKVFMAVTPDKKEYNTFIDVPITKARGVKDSDNMNFSNDYIPF